MAIADDLLLDAARAGDERAFQRLVEPYREMLEVHCYRMLGSLHDAEDRVQETLLRAWQRLDAFQHRSSLKTWLYRIATNACLDEIDRRPRRPDLVDPFPDERATGPLADPAARYAQREGMELAFLIAIQRLPGRQRAVLILHDVLGWTAPEAADLLETSTAAVNSALQRARAALDGELPPAAAPDPSEHDLLRRYIDAWDRLDINGLVSLLRDDAVMRMPPQRSISGAHAIAQFVAGRGGWSLEATSANGRPAILMREHGVMVLDVAGGEIAGIDVFIGPELAERFAR